MGELYAKTGHIKEALVLAFNPPPIFGLGTTGGYEFYIQNRGDGGSAQAERGQGRVPRHAPTRTRSWAARRRSGTPTVPQLFVDVDREKAKKVGVPIDDIFDTLSATMGTYYVNDFNKYGRTWQVLMSSEPQFRKQARRHPGVYVRSNTGEMVPLSSLVTVKYISGPDSLDRFNNLPAVKIIGQAAPGLQLGTGDRARRADRRRGAAGGLQLRLGRLVATRRRSRAAPRRSRSASR